VAVALEIAVEPATTQQAEIARAAYRDFGKGSGHPAGAQLRRLFRLCSRQVDGEPLLFKDDAFSRTDVAIA
jgi:ribonuclease VapC